MVEVSHIVCPIPPPTDRPDQLHCDKCRWTARRGECIPSTEEQLEAKESLARCQSCRKMKRSRSWGKVIPVILNPLKIAIHKDARRGASKEQAGNADPDVGGLGGQAGDHNSAGRGKRVDAEVKDREFLLHLSEGTKHVLGEVLVQQQELEESQAMEMVQKLDRIRLGG